MNNFISLDLPAILATLFAAISCAIVGNYLVLRKQSLMGDSISHSVLPGIVVAFMLTSTRDSLTVFLGAAVAGILSALATEAIRRYGNMEPGAAMGVVFSIFFAFGIILIEKAAARNVDLDADCLLHGQLESIFWLPPYTIQNVPAEIWQSFMALALVSATVWLFYKELKISSFDPALSTSLGFNSSLLHYLLMVLVACTVVASFRIVGSILVIAMIVVPASVGRLATDKLGVQIAISVLTAFVAVIAGYFLSGFGPIALGYSNSVSAAGGITVCLGLVLGLVLAGGAFKQALHQKRLGLSVRKEDVLASLYREQDLPGDSLTEAAIKSLKNENLLAPDSTLTDSGEERAADIVRSHRLWETYLVQEAGFRSDHVHETAERLEHVTDEELQQKIKSASGEPKKDPHGKDIP